MRFILASLVVLGACVSDPGAPVERISGAEAVAPEDEAAAAAYLLRVSPASVGAKQHFGGLDGAPLRFTFTVPSALRGGGLPLMLNTGLRDDIAVLEIELPQMPAGETDESHVGSFGYGLFDAAPFCRVGEACDARGQDGNWRAYRVRLDGTVDELQTAVAMRDSISPAMPYRPTVGVYLRRIETLRAGDRVRLEYTGHVPARATEWTGLPFVAHFRYRSFGTAADGTWTPGPWTVLDDSQVQGMQILPDAQAAFVKVVAPLDVQVGESFSVAVVVTDRYGNPRPVQGSVALTGAVETDVAMNGSYRAELDATIDEPGAQPLVASLPGARSIWQWLRATTEPPPVRRMLGDIHIHTGDGGAQRKFLGTFMPGDHAALYSRTRDTLGYLEHVAGYDFGSVSEHAVRAPAYALPEAVANDAAFQPGGECAGVGRPIDGLDDWWARAQSVAGEYASDPENRLLVFPAFEWHAQHKRLTDTSPLHRVVLFRSFDPDDALPILPGDVDGVPPQCLLRFLTLAGYDPSRALVVPHMMQAGDTNVDWDLTYRDSSLAPRSDVEAYTPVGEIFSARAYDQGRAIGPETLTAFEGDDAAPGPWTYRYGWRDLSARIGVIGSSDNHSQCPGSDDPLPADGTPAIHTHEPAGTAIVLAETRDHAGVYEALRARRSYATSGVRVWLDTSIDGAPMGSVIERSTDAATASFEVLAGMSVVQVELWAARTGSGDPYELAYSWTWTEGTPSVQTTSGTVALANPVEPGGAAEEWLYYVRVFFETMGAEDGEAEDAAWSSPIWVRWSR